MDQTLVTTDRWREAGQRIDRAADALREAAATEDAPDAGLAVLARTGLLALAATETAEGYGYDIPWRTALHALARIGGADLSLGRLFEGHLNALQLVALYGSPEQRRLVLTRVRAGTLLGVWGADTEPRFAVAEDGATLKLSGAKRYASGLGLVGLALVPYEDGERVSHLLLLPVGDADRQDGTSWRMRGMRGSRSGTYRFQGLTPDTLATRVGQPGDYRREPFFVGGIWRCAAAQLGAVERLVELIVADLAASERLQHPMQSARVGAAIMAARDARLNVEAAAEAVETGTDAELAVSLAALARLRVESAALEVSQIAERGLGLGVFHVDHPAERILRDLSVYLRQANPDALLLDHARRLSRRLPDLFR